MTRSGAAWAVRWTREGARSLRTIPPRVLPAILAFAETALATDPPRRTHALREPLTGMRSGNVGSYRVLVEVDPVDMMVWVVRAAYHADVYRGR